MIFFISLGALLVLVGLSVVPLELVYEYFSILLNLENLRIYLGIAGVIILFINFAIVKLSLNQFQRQKNIAFANPDGQVLVSLSAIEDLIRKTAFDIPQLKDIKPEVVATKKGILVSCKIVLFSDINIPDATENIQTLVKNKIQELLGLEESVTVKIHIAKIVSREKQKEKTQSNESLQHPPYRNF
jgi:uncharacterized alkaline shock family protein YloU